MDDYLQLYTFEQVLTDKTAGWKRAGLRNWFEDRQQIEDAWAQSFSYCSHEDYLDDRLTIGVPDDGRGAERTPGKRDFYNSKTFQLYSKGANMQCWPDEIENHPRLGGTEEDDVRNWKQDSLYANNPYP